ncbi:hypothetical protein FRC10_004858 [Ceratobasidium sp. 414]|nr:hypothetical protein FRC10_004858 [Ceratobasidium sp. 414]
MKAAAVIVNGRSVGRHAPRSQTSVTPSTVAEQVSAMRADSSSGPSAGHRCSSVERAAAGKFYARRACHIWDVPTGDVKMVTTADGRRSPRHLFVDARLKGRTGAKKAHALKTAVPKEVDEKGKMCKKRQETHMDIESCLARVGCAAKAQKKRAQADTVQVETAVSPEAVGALVGNSALTPSAHA